MEGASRELPQNLEFLFNIDEHSTSCVRMDVVQYGESFKSISLFIARDSSLSGFFGPHGRVASDAELVWL